VTRTGKLVKKWKVGDEVVTPSHYNGFQNYVIVPDTYPHTLMPGLTIDQSPAIIVYVTVARGLWQLAQLQKGETLLVHSATGAVGLVAIQYAQYIGATVIATASNEQKREYLRSLGVTFVADSRSLEFTEKVLSWTDGKGVDVVINSLSNDFLFESWKLLKPYGRFVEIGKKDISENRPLPMGLFHKNLSFFAIDLDQMYLDNFDLVLDIIDETAENFKKGIFKVLPIKTYPAREIKEAFNYFGKGEHIGKIHVKFEGEKIPVTQQIESSVFKPDATYLITGGLGGFGLALAKWLAEKRGVKHLVLISRSGLAKEEAKEAIESLKRIHVDVLAEAVDVTDEQAIAALIAKIQKQMPPLRGIIHSAMVLEDLPFIQMQDDQLAKVLAPKIKGALNLAKLSPNHLDFFVMFSSISSVIGNALQSNYAAANSFLDAFAFELRQTRNLPASVINWGALSESGILERSQGTAEYLDKLGVKGFSNTEAFWYLEKHLENLKGQSVISKIEWKALAKSLESAVSDSKFSDFIKEGGRGSNEMTLKMRALSQEERSTLIRNIIFEVLASNLHLHSESISASQTFGELGVDSLMKVDFQTDIEKKLNIRIPLMVMKKETKIKEVEDYLIDKFS
jgi:NADPH:quinone reductase-like Zn-dependent oxidoreductase/acyl carrier protein